MVWSSGDSAGTEGRGPKSQGHLGEQRERFEGN